MDPNIPARYQYLPADQRQDIIEGWWVVRKYNCMGCHPGACRRRHTIIQGIKRYQDPDWKDQKPPSLIGEGARVDPAWLMAFLNNPSRSESDTDRNGVRQYLKIRMPTFYFSDGEIKKIVRFFEAMSSQAAPYIPQKLDPLTDQERNMARQLFTSEGAPCLKCHATGDPKRDAHATAPNFTLAKERLKPGWTKRWILDPGADGSGNGDAVGPVQAGWWPLGFRWTDAVQFQRLPEGPGRFASQIHVPIHTGRAQSPARERGFGSRPIILRKGIKNEEISDQLWSGFAAAPLRMR